MQRNVFQAIVDSLDFDQAVKRGSKRNDLLPPRLEDSVGGEVGKRYSESLKDSLHRGKYDATPAATVFVPKPGNTTRPAALLLLSDRIVYSAITDTLRPRVESGLLGEGIVCWPRGELAQKAWNRFENYPLEVGLPFVVRADITGFYESIDHEILRDVLLALTGKRHEVNALIEFIARVMNSNKGIPQGLEPSDVLATAYLSQVDSHMTRLGVNYCRHGDDIRICSADSRAARESIYEFERNLRAHGLLMNAPKSEIMTLEEYKGLLSFGDRIEEATREALSKEMIDELDQDDGSGILDLIKKSGDEELGWIFFYHHAMTFEELVDALRGAIEPEDAEIAQRLLEKALEDTAGLEGIKSRDEFHYRVTKALIRLSACKSPSAIPYLQAVLERSPEKADLVAQYLMSLEGEHAREICSSIESVINDTRFFTAWEMTWLFRVALEHTSELTRSLLETIEGMAVDEQHEPLLRLECVKILGKVGSLDQLLVRRMWNTLSPVYRPDLLAAAYYATGSADWCKPFLDAAKGDAVSGVVLKHLDAASG